MPQLHTGASGTSSIPDITEIIKFIFSWVILLPISVIVSGKLIAQYLKLRGSPKQLFRIKIPPILTIEATGSEVTLGFAGFITTLLVVGLPFGHTAYELIKWNLGLPDPGQFNCICVLSSFSTVLWSFFVYAVVQTVSQYRAPEVRAAARERDTLIEDIARGRRP